MAIRTVKSTVCGATSATGVFTPDSGASALGQIMRIAGTVSALSTDNAGSQYHLCDLPASCILLPESAIQTTGWAFAQAVVGADGFTDQLLDVTRATGGATGNTPITAFGAKWNVPIWQQLGMTAAPLDFITLKAFAEADATTDGDLHFALLVANHV